MPPMWFRAEGSEPRAVLHGTQKSFGRALQNIFFAAPFSEKPVKLFCAYCFCRGNGITIFIR